MPPTWECFAKRGKPATGESRSAKMKTCHTIDEAVDWLEQQVRRHSAQLHRPTDVLYDLEDRIAWARKDLGDGIPVEWGYWLADREILVEWVIINASSASPRT